LTGLALADASCEETRTVYTFCEAVGLPTTLADIGIADINRDKMKAVAQKACAPGECIHHEAGEITPGKVLNAMLAANALGEERKKTACRDRSPNDPPN
jgi:glycerol dehydrogenase